jgi:CHASE2 domain-containing sensor protein
MKFKSIFEKLLQEITPYLPKRRPRRHYLNWRHWEKEEKLSFFTNFGIGLTLGIAFMFMTHLQIMESLFNSTIDKIIKKETGALVTASEACFKNPVPTRECQNVRSKISNHIVFIDIDSDTYIRWGEPLLIPRDKIAFFLTLADRNKARMVYLDILFDHPSNRPGEDAELRKCLGDLTKKKSEIKVIFPTIHSAGRNQIKKNIFDDLIDKNPNFYRGFPYSSFSKYDRTVRYLRYYDVVKGSDGNNLVLWGVPILTAALWTNDLSKLKALEPKILEDVQHQKRKKYHLPLSNGRRIEVGNNELFSNRIRFSLLPPGTLSKEGTLFGERMLPDEVEPLQQELRDKIVIIGTSSPDKEGWYLTPVGEMPGIYIIGNALNVLLGDWQVRDAPLWVNLLVNLMVILFACYMFVHFSISAARTLSAIFASMVVIPTTYFFYIKYGIFINTVFLFLNLLIPVLAMGWYRLQENIKKLISGHILKFFSHS